MIFANIVAGTVGFFRSATRSLSPTGWLLVAILIILVVVMSTCAIRSSFKDDRPSRGEVIKDQQARENAADSRLTDTTKRLDNTEKLNEAVAPFPDTRPSDRRLALECQRMRNNGVARLPAFCGPTPQPAAQPRPG